MYYGADHQFKQANCQVMQIVSKQYMEEVTCKNLFLFRLIMLLICLGFVIFYLNNNIVKSRQ